MRSAARATSVAFVALGFAFASWAARIPQVKDRLALSPSELGLVLLAIAAGSVVALPLSGAVVGRLGSRRTTAAAAVLLALSLGVVALGYLTGVPLLVVGLFVLGLANGTWDVAMNVQGALVEQHLGRAVMSRFHAGFSLGTVAGALVGAAAVALRVPVTAHLLVAAVVVGTTVPPAVRRYVPDHPAGTPPGAPEPGRARSAWREPRTLLVGVFVLAFAFAEGTANDWVSVAFIDGHGVPEATATVGFAVFLAAMTAVRWAGPGLLDRHGRVPVVRGLAAVAAAGLALFVFAPTVWLAFLGVLLWGAGTSLGFPVGMSAAADAPARAAARVSVVASIGYCAFLAGPPLIGFLGQHVGVLRALVVVAALLALSAAIADALRPPARARR